jgi:hypothetical protein
MGYVAGSTPEPVLTLWRNETPPNPMEREHNAIPTELSRHPSQCNKLKQQNKTRLVSNSGFLGFEVLRTVIMNSFIFWDITLCSPLKANRRFGGTAPCRLFYTGLLVCSFFDPEAVGSIFLRNAG